MSSLSAERTREVESVIIDWMNENDVPGASIVIVDEDDELYAEGFGARDVESNASATPDTLYGMGSITKSLTALAVIQLDETGELRIDDHVDDYVNHYEDAPGEPISIEDLLTHTSGMPATPTGAFDQALEGFPAGVADRSDLKRFVRESTEFRTTDEERFFYYNTGYAILGEVIEVVDGRSYEQYVTEEIFEPLGMERATFDPDVLENDADGMTGYKAGSDNEPPEAKSFPLPELDRPAGGMIASVRDLASFLRAMMTDGSVAGTRVCSPDAVERLQEGRTVRQTFLDGSTQQYGYGWMRQPLAADELIGHGGSILVSTSYSGYLADAGVGVVLACNTSTTPHTGGLGAAILAVVAGKDKTAAPAYAFKEKCEAVAGTYESFREELTITVEHDPGELSVTFESNLGEEELTAFPSSLDPAEHEFYTVTGAGAKAPLEFDLDGDRADLYFKRIRARRTNSAM